MPELPTVNAARLALQQGALGVGEHHNSSNARHHVYEWMLNGLVNQLVLELDNIDNYTLGEYAQALGFIDNQWPNDIGLLDIWRMAENLGIETRAWDPGDQLALTANENLVNRNIQVITGFVNQHAPGALHAAVPNAVGTIILFGAGHFGVHPMSLNMLLGDTLPWIDLH